ncbi:hypothetical protein [uncultured Pseudokineococcus sp.]|uniref:hypothetical protein n=1 Tax=uncultured Pseudokineococcus sp. TaxID=1642928 RepID=UPI002609FF26|nr:hypothetical protein [uncultured Pseudokineococcus sp.]
MCSAPYDPADPAGPPPVQYTPEQVLQMALAQLEIEAPEIGITPKPGPGIMGTVGVPVWLWTPEALWEPQSVTAAVPGLSVTAVSQLADVTYDMGDGTDVVCDEPGIPYDRSYGLQVPECGHIYEQTSAGQAGQEYPITATARYEITWTGAAEGSDELTASSPTALPVGEYQAIVTSG